MEVRWASGWVGGGQQYPSEHGGLVWAGCSMDRALWTTARSLTVAAGPAADHPVGKVSHAVYPKKANLRNARATALLRSNRFLTGNCAGLRESMSRRDIIQKEWWGQEGFLCTFVLQKPGYFCSWKRRVIVHCIYPFHGPALGLHLDTTNSSTSLHAMQKPKLSR